VRGTGFIDLTVGLRDSEPCDTRCPRAYAALIAHARRLSLDFRFRSGSEEVDSRATRDLDRVVQFLRDYPGATLLLLGFSDPAGAASANLKLSQHRAATIARELELRGVHAQRVEGFGAAMPIASNAGDTDRQRNRRVEIWLETAHWRRRAAWTSWGPRPAARAGSRASARAASAWPASRPRIRSTPAAPASDARWCAAASSTDSGSAPPSWPRSTAIRVRASRSASATSSANTAISSCAWSPWISASISTSARSRSRADSASSASGPWPGAPIPTVDDRLRSVTCPPSAPLPPRQLPRQPPPPRAASAWRPSARPSSP